MNAASNDRQGEVQSDIRKVRTFGRVARVVCAAIFGFGLVGAVVGFLIAGAQVIFPGADSVTMRATPQLRMWVCLIGFVVIGSWLAIVHQLYRLFGNLATGAIYTPENVRRVRRVGVLWLLLAAAGIAIPFGSTALIALGFFDSTAPYESLLVFPWSQTLSSAISAGLILLASWIMDVGLYAKDHADALQRDAELVI